VSRFFILWGGRNLENIDYGGVSVEIEIDGERIKEKVGGRGWDVVFVFVKRHITEPMDEVNQRKSPSAGAYRHGK